MCGDKNTADSRETLNNCGEGVWLRRAALEIFMYSHMHCGFCAPGPLPCTFR
jgi:hypothetical protein